MLKKFSKVPIQQSLKIGSIVINCYQFEKMLAFWQEALHYVPRKPVSDGWAGMDYQNLVSVRTYLADPSYDEANVQLRIRYLGDNKPASTVICCKLLDHKWKLEVEALAAK